MIIQHIYDLNDIIRIINNIRLRKNVDLLVKNANIIEVATGTIYEGSVAVIDRHIAYVVSKKDPDIPAFRIIDAKGKYLLPGFIDSHAHIESSMVTPLLYSQYQLKQGTTTAIVDPHEVVNVAGLDGLKAFIDELEKAPMRFLIQIPPCVPASEEKLETSYLSITPNDIRKLMKEMPNVISGLAEVMCYEKILSGNNDLFEMIAVMHESRLIIDGHASKLENEDLQAYVASKIMTDHTVRTVDELIERLKLGLYIEIQNRTQETEFPSIVKKLKEIDTSRVMWCTDDAEADELASNKYSLKAIIRDAIEHGLDPIKAIKMATINVAQAYRIDDKIGIIAPGRYADMVIVDSIDKLDIFSVIIDGRIYIYDDNVLMESLKHESSLLRFKGNTILLRRNIDVKDLLPTAPVKKGKAIVHVLSVKGGVEIFELDIRDYVIMSNPEIDVAWINVIERHGKTGDISKGFVTGTGIKTGAFVSSFSHDSHNLLVISVDAKSSLACLNNVISSGGGICLSIDGKVVSSVPLPFYGLMSSDPSTPHKLEIFKEKLREAGFKVPLKRLLTLTLPVRKSGYAFTDKGLVDYKKGILPVLINAESV